MEKMYDFGVYGKWSKSTLKANLTWGDSGISGIDGPPEAINIKRGELGIERDRIRNKRISKLAEKKRWIGDEITVETLFYWFQRLKEIDESIEQYQKIKEICFNLKGDENGKKTNKRR